MAAPWCWGVLGRCWVPGWHRAARSQATVGSQGWGLLSCHHAAGGSWAAVGSQATVGSGVTAGLWGLGLLWCSWGGSLLPPCLGGPGLLGGLGLPWRSRGSAPGRGSRTHHCRRHAGTEPCCARWAAGRGEVGGSQRDRPHVPPLPSLPAASSRSPACPPIPNTLLALDNPSLPGAASAEHPGSKRNRDAAGLGVSRDSGCRGTRGAAGLGVPQARPTPLPPSLPWPAGSILQSSSPYLATVLGKRGSGRRGGRRAGAGGGDPEGLTSHHDEGERDGGGGGGKFLFL